MSYTLTKAQIEAVTLTDSRLFTDALKLRHLKTGRAGIECRSRNFWLESNVDGDGGVTGPFTPDLSGQPRLTFSLTLTVSYRMHERRDVMDEVLASDQRDYSIALLKPSNWATSTTGLLSLTANPSFLPTRRTVLADSVEQRTFLSLWFR